MKNEEDFENPWTVENIEDFLYFCCPECDERNQSKELFMKHALDKHPKSKEPLLKFQVKKEPSESESPEKINTNDNNFELLNSVTADFKDSKEDFKNDFYSDDVDYDNYDIYSEPIVKCEIKEDYDDEDQNFDLAGGKNENEIGDVPIGIFLRISKAKQF